MFMDVIDIEEFPDNAEEFKALIEEEMYDDIYQEEEVYDRLDNGAISDAEEGFMKGYLEA